MYHDLHAAYNADDIRNPIALGYFAFSGTMLMCMQLFWGQKIVRILYKNPENPITKIFMPSNGSYTSVFISSWNFLAVDGVHRTTMRSISSGRCAGISP